MSRSVNRHRPAQILSLMSKSPGILFTTDDIMNGCSYSEKERGAVTQMLGRFVLEGKLDRYASGTFVYRNSNKPEKQETTSTMYEYIGRLDDGSLIMRNESNGLERFTKN